MAKHVHYHYHRAPRIPGWLFWVMVGYGFLVAVGPPFLSALKSALWVGLALLAIGVSVRMIWNSAVTIARRLLPF